MLWGLHSLAAMNGCDLVAEPWDDFKENIQTIPAPQKVWQVFVDGKRMKLARFPDMGEEATLLS
ncbi:hypothetical protein SH580_04715 [Coraliomargarita algicola]|uniref:Uncharacterized protein n=1 Tax=Coraliomargarita algicola TaxID=3092156 RepID=A0ABZ0RNL6_9BACT|nr:hypothetical protein [Coraliomargarita sp. J2-16]WPJ97008.1 hypothetical protein SH580_04715 [Coraliomargarita sp. J2-16]